MQKGVDPDYIPTKRYQKSGESSTTPFIMDPDFSSGDDSDDGDFELVPRFKSSIAHKKAWPSATSRIFSHDAETMVTAEPSNGETIKDPSDSDDEILLMTFLVDLKNWKTSTSPQMLKDRTMKAPIRKCKMSLKITIP